MNRPSGLISPSMPDVQAGRPRTELSLTRVGVTCVEKVIRVDAGEVRIRRRGRAIVLEPVPESWEWLDALAGDVDDDFVSAVREQPDGTERPGLAKVFR